MAIQPISHLKNLFKRGKLLTQEGLWDLLDSYVHHNPIATPPQKATPSEVDTADPGSQNAFVNPITLQGKMTDGIVAQSQKIASAKSVYDTRVVADRADVLSKTNQTKLNGIQAGAQVNVNPDWTETDTTKSAFIAHKPDPRYMAQWELAAGSFPTAGWVTIGRFSYYYHYNRIYICHKGSHCIFNISTLSGLGERLASTEINTHYDGASNSVFKKIRTALNGNDVVVQVQVVGASSTHKIEVQVLNKTALTAGAIADSQLFEPFPSGDNISRYLAAPFSNTIHGGVAKSSSKLQEWDLYRTGVAYQQEAARRILDPWSNVIYSGDMEKTGTFNGFYGYTSTNTEDTKVALIISVKLP